MVKFMSNTISLNSGSFKDYVEKQASSQDEEKLTKTAGELPDALKEHQFGKSDDADSSDKKDDDDGEEVVEDEEKEAAAKQVTKEASDDEADSSGQLDVEPLHQEGDQTAEGEDKKAKKASKDKGGDEADSSGQLDVEPLHQEGESTGDKPGDLDTQKDKKASSDAKFEKIAKLSGPNRKFLEDYLPGVWPAAYVEQMLAEH